MTNPETPKHTHVAMWSDYHGNTYEQGMILTGDAKHIAAQLAAHKAWVFEQQNVVTYKVMVPSTPNL